MRGVRGVRNGFTLIELVTVLAIIGIIVTFTIPRVDISGYRATGSVQVLGTTMMTAQRQALTQQHNIVVWFDSAGRTIKIHQDRDNDTAIDAAEHVRTVYIGEGMVFGLGAAPARGALTNVINVTRTSGGTKVLIFHRDGSASEAGGFYVTSLRAAQGAPRPTDTRLVIFDRATGRASWYRYGQSGWAKVF